MTTTTDTPTTLDLDAIEARANAATPGPWGVGNGTHIVRGLEVTGRGSYTCIQSVAEVADEEAGEDPGGVGVGQPAVGDGGAGESVFAAGRCPAAGAAVVAAGVDGHGGGGLVVDRVDAHQAPAPLAISSRTSAWHGSPGLHQQAKSLPASSQRIS